MAVIPKRNALLPDPMIIKLPYKITSQEVFKYLRDLPLDENEEIIFDFKECNFLDPMAMLVLSSEISGLKKNYNIHIINYGHLSYPSHMGFFKSMGIDFGKSPRREEFKYNYIPIRIIDSKNIKETASKLNIHYGEFLENYFVPDFLKILTNKLTQNVIEILKYCLREIIRNIIEHSDCEKFGICGQFYFQRNQIALAVVDRGIGLKKSLEFNPKLEILDDKQAIQLALKQGVSGKVYSGMKNKPKGIWANSGYGLYMTSSICQMDGEFTIVSGEFGCHFNNNVQNFFRSSYHGTALSMSISLNLNYKLNELLNTINGNLPKIPKPSTASLRLVSGKYTK